MTLEELTLSGTKFFGCDVNMDLLVIAHVILRLAYILGPIGWFKHSLSPFFKPSFEKSSFVLLSVVILYAMTSIVTQRLLHGKFFAILFIYFFSLDSCSIITSIGLVTGSFLRCLTNVSLKN